MNNLFESIKSCRRNLFFIGLSPLTANKEQWKKLKEELSKRFSAADLSCNFIGESDSQLFQTSLITDAPYTESKDRVSFSMLKFRRDLVKKELVDKINNTETSTYKFSTLPINCYVVKVDEEIWICPSNHVNANLNSYIKMDDSHKWYSSVKKMTDSLLMEDHQGRYLAKPDDELLELFDQDQIPRGIYPRNCFYDTDHFQFVVWGLIFSREGELLIHQRSENAKDNQGQWDKSIGGHVDFTKERSSHYAAVRELIEELFTDEKASDDNLLTPSVEKPHFLGDWRSEKLGIDYLDHIKAIEREKEPGKEPWVYYRLPDTLEHYTPRTLPDDTVKKLRVIADTFIFIANTRLNRAALRTNELSNSIYDLVRPAELKTWIDQGKTGKNDFVPTPDLLFIMNGKLRDVIEQVSQLIQYSDIRQQNHD